MAGYWMKFGSCEGERFNEMCEVSYTTPSLGFRADKKVSFEMQQLLKIAYEAGKEERSKEILRLLQP